MIATEIDPGEIDNVVRAIREKLPEAGRQAGFAGFCLLTDREAGRLLTISLWSTYDDVAAAQDLAAQLRGRTAPPAGAVPAGPVIYEVAVRALPARRGLSRHYVQFTMICMAGWISVDASQLHSPRSVHAKAIMKSPVHKPRD